MWLDFDLSCKYINKEIYAEFKNRSEEVGKMLNHMIENLEKYKLSKVVLN